VSATLLQARVQVQALINEMDAKKSAISLPRLDTIMRGAYMTLQAELPPIESVTTSAGTISSDSFTLPTTSSAQYSGLVWIRLQSTGAFLTEVSREEMNAMRALHPTAPSSIPLYFAMYEGSDQTVNCRCESSTPTPLTYDLHTTKVAADFDLTSLDTTTLALSRYGIQSLIYQTAAEVAATFTDEDLALRRLNPSVVPFWFKQADRMQHLEKVRLNQLHSQGRAERWVP